VPEGVRAGQAVDDTQGGSQPALYPWAEPERARRPGLPGGSGDGV